MAYDGYKNKEISELLNINVTSVTNIVLNKTFYDPEYTPKITYKNSRPQLKDDEISKMYEMYESGKPILEIAEYLGTTKQAIYSRLKGIR